MDGLSDLDLQSLLSLSPEELEERMKRMQHSDLYRMRYKTKDQNLQNLISPYEHRAFAREATQENPLMGLPIAVGTLAYQPYKMMTQQSRSQPSLQQILQGLTGVFEGYKSKF